MNSIVIRPLETDYQSLKVSVTELEAFKDCPRKFKEVPRMTSAAKEFWNKADKILKSAFMNYDNYNFLCEYAQSIASDKNETKRLWDYLDLVEENKNTIPRAVFWDEKMSISIEAWKYLLTITWILDLVHIDWTISDIKTSDNWWKQWDQFNKLQCYLYPLMYYWVDCEDTKVFNYLIFTKHKRDRCKLDIRSMNINMKLAKELLIKIAKQYIVMNHLNEWEERKNIYCNGCELLKNNLCNQFI